MRAGNQIRVNAQLLEAPSGTVMWSQGGQSPLDDLFKVQDDFTQQIVKSLSIPLTRREAQMLKRDVPATARAYEFYLRGNECATERATWTVALDLYRQCLDEDPRFAPAWARLGRMQRLTALYVDPERADSHLEAAEASFGRALDLNPDLPLAHNLYAYLEVDCGRAKEAMLRLLDLARRRRADPEIFAGLVHACRYCGLLQASIAAFEKGHRLDPSIRTSVSHSYWYAGQIDRAVETDIASDVPFMKVLAQVRAGKSDQVIARLKELGARGKSNYGRGWQRLAAALTRDIKTFEDGLDEEVAALRDPESIFYFALMAMVARDTDRVIAMLKKTLDRGWYCHQAIATEPILDGLRSDSRLSQILGEMQSRQQEAEAAFVEAGGDRLLGLDP
jgi:tetratricopeptide (TPR) repeat protein